MVITLGIMLLLFAAVFEIMTGVFESSSTLKDNQNHRDEIVALGAFLKNELGVMPVQSAFISYRRGDGEGLIKTASSWATRTGPRRLTPRSSPTATTRSVSSR